MRVALAGLGDIGLGAHLPALRANPAVDVVALVDPVAAQATAKDLDEVLDDVDAVVLATPPWVTPHLAVQALRRGRYVLAEKPLATSMAEAAIYDRLTGEERRRLQAGLTYRHDPAIERLRGWIATGALGSPLLVRAHIYDEARDRPDHLKRLTTTLEHGTPLVHEGAHVFDWLAHLLGGDPEVEDAWSLRTDPAYPAANLTGARLAYPGGHVALVEFGWLTRTLPRCELSFLGPDGHALLDGFTFRLSRGGEVVDFPGERGARSFARQLDRFVELATGQRHEPEPGLDDALKALELGERIARML